MHGSCSLRIVVTISTRYCDIQYALLCHCEHFKIMYLRVKFRSFLRKQHFSQHLHPFISIKSIFIQNSVYACCHLRCLIVAKIWRHHHVHLSSLFSVNNYAHSKWLPWKSIKQWNYCVCFNCSNWGIEYIYKSKWLNEHFVVKRLQTPDHHTHMCFPDEFSRVCNLIASVQ